MTGRALIALGVLGLIAAPAIAQPRRPTAAPVVTPAPAPPPVPTSGSGSKAKPTAVYESCFGPKVFITSRIWRECCILCAAGSDVPSTEEVDEYVEANTCQNQAPVVNQYFTLNGRGKYEGGAEGAAADAAANPDAARAKGGKPGAKASPFARNQAGGLAGLSALRPSVGGFE